MPEFTLRVNGKDQSVEAEPDSPLLYILRSQLNLNGPKFGCGLAQCGACTVLADGKAIRSCQTPVSNVADREIVTLEGLSDGDEPGAMQRAFIEEQAAQCGYCINGMVMTAQALLNDNPDPTDEEIRNGLAGNLCRCGTHTRILRAVKRAAGEGATAS
jgi:nicotinate dehydrogenase subunit A